LKKQKTMRKKISAVQVVHNGIDLGYPFVEAITQVIPHVDEFVVVEAGSIDGTMDVLRRLAEKYSNLRIEYIFWPLVKVMGVAIGMAQNQALRFCRGDYVLLVQADELWHNRSIVELRSLIDSYPKIKSFSFPFNHIYYNFQKIITKDIYSSAIRLVKNSPDLRSEGDGWTLCGPILPTHLATLLVPICHVGSVGVRSVWRKLINHSHLYPELKEYAVSAEWARQGLEGSRPLDDFEKIKTTPYPELIPDIIKPMIGCDEYFVREELLS